MLTTKEIKAIQSADDLMINTGIQPEDLYYAYKNKR